MKTSLNWIMSCAQAKCSPEEYQHKMIMSGTAVDDISPLFDFSGVVVGRVLTCEKHENSDHLHVCQVDVGEDSPLQIVCGAPNVKAGLLVPTAVVGAKLSEFTIKKGKIRGVESQGMLCSATELMIPQEVYPSVGEAGLLILNEEYAPGTDLLEALDLDDHVVDFDILANRPDCLSVWGVARETAAVFKAPFDPQLGSVKEAGGDIRDYARVDVENSTLCPRYQARVVKNIRLAPSPLWMRARLHAAGMRAINNIVDITNYVMLETGHPMHAFDLNQVKGRHIIVREASPDETLTTLDGKKHRMRGGELLICDENGPTGLAGIMGGLESEITENTQKILFECAAFDRTLTRIVSRRLGIRTESSGRFEKGVNPATVQAAMDRACELINLLNAGDVVSGVIDLYPNPVSPVNLTCSVKRIAHRAGVDIKGEDMVDILHRLDFKAALDGDALKVTPPIHRTDIEMEDDVCEEVLRLYGFEHIPETLLRGETTPGKDSPYRLMKRRYQRTLSALGFDEIFNFSFTAQKQLDNLGLPAGDARLSPIKIKNPLGEDTAVMRTTLAPDMLKTLAYNIAQRNEEARLYEFGTIYDAFTRTQEGLFAEKRALCLGAYGDKADFYQMRDAVLTMLEQARLRADIQKGGEAYHHPGRSARILINGKAIALVGEVHPAAAERFNLTRRCFIAEVDFELLSELFQSLDAVKALPKTPAVHRDLALVLEKEQELLPVLREIEKAGSRLLEEVRLFDVFEGEQVGQGKKSAAFSLKLRDPEKTLEEAEIIRVIEKVKKKLKDAFQAEIRS